MMIGRMRGAFGADDVARLRLVFRKRRFQMIDDSLWPGRPDYRSVFLLWGPGIAKSRLPEMSMLEILPRLRSILF